MAQPEYGAAQGLIDLARKYYDGLNKFSDFMGRITPQKKEDTSWHDSMVKGANESFRKNSERKLTAKGPTLGGKKPFRKKATKKAAARKR